jgi:hypothetical protein
MKPVIEPLVLKQETFSRSSHHSDLALMGCVHSVPIEPSMLMPMIHSFISAGTRYRTNKCADADAVVTRDAHHAVVTRDADAVVTRDAAGGFNAVAKPNPAATPTELFVPTRLTHPPPFSIVVHKSLSFSFYLY